MNRVRAIALICGVTIVVTIQLAIKTDSIAQSSNSAATWKLLQQGKLGYVVLMRHAAAPGTGDPANF